MRKLLGWSGIALILAALAAGFNAYFVLRFDPQTTATYDGFGRVLLKSPWFVRFLLGQDHLWAGWFWLLIDMISFWVAVVIGFSLAGWGLKDEPREMSDTPSHLDVTEGKAK